MANNTIMTAKSTFGDGLLMDFAPDNTQATCLTHALNATLLTMNGNELSLLNDMGNGRVETAYLPEGYVPVGTCEFGDIIYIVSYNPITNKSLIGCFPSPERNISSKELSGTETEFNLDNFVESSGFGFKQTKNNSIKQIIYENNLNPGDKFIVHSGNIASKSNIISDYGNTLHKVGSFPKLYKINVVAIEDSGKINYLNSNLKWYTNYTNQGNLEEVKKDGDFYINSESEKDLGKPDIDSYRNILNSGYSVFQSKVSGKLAILIELERIESFNSTYEIYTKLEKSNNLRSAQADTIITNIVNKPNMTGLPTIEYKDYSIYINFNWETNNPNINPSLLVAYDFNWISNSIEISDVNNAAGSFMCGTTIKKLDLIKNFPRNTITTGTVTEGETSIDGYIHRTISNYENFSTETYNDFITHNYDASIANEKYANATKINQSYDDSGKPIEGQYYLNLHHIVVKEGKNTYYNDKGGIIDPQKNVPDCIVNNYFKSSISKHMFDISIPDKFNGEAIDCRNLILSYKVAPMMEYGVLTDLVQTHYIDFSKIGSGEISLNGYKYYNGENLCTLLIDSSIYPEENKGVAGIELQFYDNQGLCAVYNINNRASYSGIITSYIPLNGNQTTYSLSSYQNDNLIAHAGLIFVEDATNYKGANYDSSLSYVYLSEVIENNKTKLVAKEVIYKDSKWYEKENTNTAVDINDSSKYKSIYYNDAGTLYSNMLYAVKIVYKYTTKNALGEYDTTNTSNEKCEWRWLWTNTMFNLYYYNVSDFKDNKFELLLDLSANYSTTAKLASNAKSENSTYDSENEYKNLGVITQTYDGTIKSLLHVGLENTYNTFSLYGDNINNADIGIYKYFNINTHIPLTFDISYDMQNSEVDEKLSTYLKPIKSNEYDINDKKDNIWSNENAYKQYTDSMLLIHKSSERGSISYMDSNLNLHENQETKYINLNLYNAVNNPILFDLKLRNYNKYYQKYETVSNLVSIEPITRDYTFLESLGIKLNEKEKHFYFENVYLISPWDDKENGDDKHDFFVKFKVDETNGTMNLSKLIDLPGIKDNRESGEYAGYWIKWGQGTASRSLLSTSGKGWFMSGPSNCKNYDANIGINYGFFLNLRLPFNRALYVNRNNLEYTDSSFKSLDTWNFQNDYPNDSNQFILALIGFMGDKKEAWHLFNDYCVLKATPTKGNYAFGYGTKVSQIPHIMGFNYTNTIADYLVSVLNSMYILKSSNSSKPLHTSNIEYEYISTYTLDIIYELVKSDNTDYNETLLIHGISYKTYLNQIEQYTGQLEDLSNKLQLKSITKNLPISINIKSKKDSVLISNIINNTEETIEHVNASLGIMQILDGVLMPINSNFKYKNGEFSNVELKNNLLDLKIKGETNTLSKNAYSVFDYSNGQLTLKRDTAVGAPENYSWTNQNRDSDVSAIYDLFKSECLINGWLLV